MAIIFSSGIQETEMLLIESQKSITFDVPLTGEGIAFYEINIKNYKQNPLFVQILDPYENIIAEQKIHTILSENFFKFETTGDYIIRVTNLNEQNIEFTIKYGDTKLNDLLIPEIITFIGSFILIYAIFRKIKSYSIAQP